MTTKPNDGGPAFPNAPALPMSSGSRKGDAGMSLRDWFAGQALAGLTADSNEAPEADESAEEYYAATAETAYALADAMLAARSHSENPL